MSTTLKLETHFRQHYDFEPESGRRAPGLPPGLLPGEGTPMVGGMRSLILSSLFASSKDWIL